MRARADETSPIARNRNLLDESLRACQRCAAPIREDRNFRSVDYLASPHGFSSSACRGGAVFGFRRALSELGGLLSIMWLGLPCFSCLRCRRGGGRKGNLRASPRDGLPLRNAGRREEASPAAIDHDEFTRPSAAELVAASTIQCSHFGMYLGRGGMTKVRGPARLLSPDGHRAGVPGRALPRR